MASKFSELPNNLIIKIIQIENDRRKYEKERYEKERMKYGEVIDQLNGLSPLTYCCSSDMRMRRQVFKTVYDKLGWERPEWFPKLVYRYVMY